MKKSIIAILMCVLIIAPLAGCGSSSTNEYYSPAPAASSAAPAAAQEAPAAGRYELGKGLSGGLSSESVAVAMDAMVDEAEPSTGGEVAGPTVTQVVDTRKIIKNVDMQMQTLTFDKGVSDINSMAESFGGFVQNSYVEGRDMYNERGTRTATFSIRVPAEKLDLFVNSFGDGDFNVTSKSQNSDDITESYYDSKARLDSLKIQETRLLSMLENATELEYMLQVEKELMNVRYEIESLTSALNRMDSYVSMSTVNITLHEVVKYVPVENVAVTFGERISRAFSGSLKDFTEFAQNFTVSIVSMLPFLLLIAVIIIIVVIIVRSAGKKSAAKRAKLQSQPIQYNQQNPHPYQPTQFAPQAQPPAPPAEEKPATPDNTEEPK